MMQVGLSINHPAAVSRLADLAPRMEAFGFESLWLAEHTHIPATYQRPYPFATDGIIPDWLVGQLDPLVALGSAAAVTTRLALGTGVCLLSVREPIVTAKAVASLDQLSSGRLLFGIGTGWIPEELAAFGVAFENRWAIIAEKLTALKALWSDGSSQFDGRYVSVPETRSLPKPVQKPHPPIFVGGASRHVRRRVVAWDAHWLPNIADPSFIARGTSDLRRIAIDAGRDPDRFSVTVMHADPTVLKSYQAAGVQRCIFNVTAESPSLALREAEDIATAIAREIPGALLG